MSIHLLRLFGLGWAMAVPDTAIPIRVELDAPPGCSSPEAFYAGVRARTERVRRAQAGEHALSLRVRLTRVGPTIHGELGGFDENGKTETRIVDGASCDEVVEALSLTAALALDPNARFAPAPTSDRGEPGTTSDPTGTNDGQAPPEKVPAERPPQEPERAPDPPHDERRDVAGASAKQFGFALGAGLLGARVVSDESNFGGAVSVRLEQRGNGIVSPSFGLALLHLRNDILASPDHVAVRWTSFALSACPVRVAARSVVSLSPCALGLAGWLNAEGQNVSQPTSVIRSWWSVGALVRGSAAVGNGLAIEFEVGLTVPLVRRRFVTAIPDEFVGQTPDVSPFGGLGVIYHL